MEMKESVFSQGSCSGGYLFRRVFIQGSLLKMKGSIFITFKAQDQGPLMKIKAQDEGSPHDLQLRVYGYKGIRV